MSARSPLRTAIIGLGRIAWILERDTLRRKPCTHAGALLERPGFAIVAAADHNSERRSAFVSWLRDQGRPAPELLADEGAPLLRNLRREIRAGRTATLDLIIIATRTDSHEALARLALECGARGLLLEKPVALDFKETLRLKKNVEQSGALFWANFERRWHPGYRLVHDFIQKQKLGPLRSIHGQVLTGATPPGAESGPLLHDAIHWLDLLVWFAGRPESVRASFASALSLQESISAAHADTESAARKKAKPSSKSKRPGVHRAADENAASREARRMQPFPLEDTAFAEFQYPNSLTARLESGGRREYFEFAVQLDFARGRIRAGNEGFFFFRSAASRRYQRFLELQSFAPRWSYRNPWSELFREIRTDLRTLRAGKASGSEYQRLLADSQVRLEDAVAGMELIDACFRSGARNRSVDLKRA